MLCQFDKFIIPRLILHSKARNHGSKARNHGSKPWNDHIEVQNDHSTVWNKKYIFTAEFYLQVWAIYVPV